MSRTRNESPSAIVARAAQCSDHDDQGAGVHHPGRDQAGSIGNFIPRRANGTCIPAARTFQALRILVNRELANLEHLLRILPHILQ